MKPKMVLFISGGMLDGYRTNVAVDVEVVDLDTPISRKTADRITSEYADILEQEDVQEINRSAKLWERLQKDQSK